VAGVHTSSACRSALPATATRVVVRGTDQSTPIRSVNSAQLAAATLACGSGVKRSRRRRLEIGVTGQQGVLAMRLPGASHQRSTGRHRHLVLRNCSTHRTAGESRATHRVQPPIEASWAERRLPASGSTSRRGGRCLLRPSLRNTGILPRFRPPDGCHIVRGPGRCKTPTSPTQGPHTHRVRNRRPVLSL
jgi:hypothetical protein